MELRPLLRVALDAPFLGAEVLAVIDADQDHCGIDPFFRIGEIGIELCRPVELVGAHEAGIGIDKFRDADGRGLGEGFFETLGQTVGKKVAEDDHDAGILVLRNGGDNRSGPWRGAPARLLTRFARAPDTPRLGAKEPAEEIGNRIAARRAAAWLAAVDGDDLGLGLRFVHGRDRRRSGKERGCEDQGRGKAKNHGGRA